MSTRKPSLADFVRSLRRFPMDQEQDLELADAIELTAQVHTSTQANADRRGNYGACTGCGALWPCPTWSGASSIAVEWLVAASNALMRRSGRLKPPLPVGKRDPGAHARRMQGEAA